MNTNGVDPQALIAGLTQALKDPDPDVRRSAISKFGQMGQMAKPAIPALLKELKDENENVGYLALVTLLKIGVPLQEALPGIIMGLKEERKVHKPIFDYLEALGPKAKDAVPALIEAFKAANPSDQEEIARVLGNIGAGAKEALPTLADFLHGRKSRRGETVAAVQEAMRNISK